MTRKEANLLIIEYLTDYIKKNPEQRFGQILRNIGVIRELRSGTPPHNWVNEFNSESTDILRRIEATLRNYGSI